MSFPMGSSTVPQRLKVAQITSSTGALVLGVGIGALLAPWLNPVAGFITILGLSIHAVGMWDAHRLEKNGQVPASRVVAALYWICWVLLAVLLIGLLVRL